MTSTPPGGGAETGPPRPGGRLAEGTRNETERERAGEPVRALGTAVRSALRVLASDLDTGTGYEEPSRPDPARMERYLRAVLEGFTPPPPTRTTPLSAQHPPSAARAITWPGTRSPRPTSPSTAPTSS